MNIPVAPARHQAGLQAVLVLPVLMLAVLAFVPDEGNPKPAVTALLLGLAALLAAVFTLTPRRLSYTLTGDALVIGKLTGAVRLPYAGLRARRAGRDTYFLTPTDPDAFLHELARRGVRVGA